jgi:hypothetical protein
VKQGRGQEGRQGGKPGIVLLFRRTSYCAPRMGCKPQGRPGFRCVLDGLWERNPFRDDSPFVGVGQCASVVDSLVPGFGFLVPGSLLRSAFMHSAFCVLRSSGFPLPGPTLPVLWLHRASLTRGLSIPDSLSDQRSGQSLPAKIVAAFWTQSEADLRE